MIIQFNSVDGIKFHYLTYNKFTERPKKPRQSTGLFYSNDELLRMRSYPTSDMLATIVVLRNGVNFCGIYLQQPSAGLRTVPWEAMQIYVLVILKQDDNALTFLTLKCPIRRQRQHQRQTICNDQELIPSETKSFPKNQNWKFNNVQIGIFE